jgi:DNA-binding transcriptional regulator YhcF (GntR family)
LSQFTAWISGERQRTKQRKREARVTLLPAPAIQFVSGFEFAASLVSSLAWPSAVVLAVYILRRPLTAAFARVRRVEALGVSAELDAVEHAREGVELELANPERDVDDLIERATEFGWHLGRAAPDVPPGVQIDRSSETPVVHSAAEEVLKRHVARIGPEENLFAWEEVANQLEELIVSGHLKAGQRLPPERQIAAEYQVALNTARKAIQTLRRRGLVVTMPEKGAFVAPQLPKFSRPSPPQSTE